MVFFVAHLQVAEFFELQVVVVRTLAISERHGVVRITRDAQDASVRFQQLSFYPDDENKYTSQLKKRQ